MAEEAKNDQISFGITEDTRSTNAPNLLPPKELDKPTNEFPQGYSFPKVYLPKVEANDNFETKNGHTQILSLTFKDDEGRETTFTEWAQDPNDQNFAKKHEGVKSRIKHIYEQFEKFPEKGIGGKASNYGEFFKEVEKEFGKINTNHFCYLKFTFYKGNKNLPLYPNFLQRIKKGEPCKLEIDSRDVIKHKPSDNAGAPPMPGGTPDNVPKFNDFE